MYECPNCKTLVGENAEECFNCHIKLNPQEHAKEEREEEEVNEIELRYDFRRRRRKALFLILISFVVFFLILALTLNLDLSLEVQKIILAVSGALVICGDAVALIIYKPRTCPFCGSHMGRYAGIHCKWCGKQVIDWL